MNEALSYARVAILGIALGYFYFGTMKWTLERMALSKHQYFLFISGSVVRMGVAIGALYVVVQQGWQHVVVCVVAFTVVRIVMAQRGLPLEAVTAADEKQEADADAPVT